MSNFVEKLVSDGQNVAKVRQAFYTQFLAEAFDSIRDFRTACECRSDTQMWQERCIERARTLLECAFWMRDGRNSEPNQANKLRFEAQNAFWEIYDTITG